MESIGIENNTSSKRKADVPTIDILPLFGSNLEEKMKVAKQIQEICHSGCGFFFVTNHGVDVLNDLFKITTDFHMNLTDEERWKLAIVAYNKVNTKQIRNGYYLPIKDKKAVESFCYLNPSFNDNHTLIKGEVPMHEVNVWPNEDKYPGFKAFHEDYYMKVFNMSSVLLSGFALALGKEENFFSTHFKKEDTLSSIRLIRYPYMENYPPRKIAEDGTELSFEAHVDVSLITVLFQPYIDPLQVEIDGEFFDIPRSDDCYLINVGGYMEHITNKYFKAPLHRVKWINAERLSLPYFANLGYYSTVQPFTPNDLILETLNKPISFGEYFENARKELIVSNGQT
jgi:isopenicillin-N synthase